MSLEEGKRGEELGRRLRLCVAIVGAAFTALVGPAGAAAQIIGPQDPQNPTANSPWQAGTCYTDTPTCSVDTPDQFFEQAGGHPPVGFTQFIVNTEEGPLPGTEIPIGNLKTVRVDLPRGLSVNPQATEQCELEPEESPATCPPGSKVGTSVVTATNTLTGASLTLPSADVFNIVPEQGEPARFGFSVLGNDVFLEAGIAWEGDFHEYFTIHAAKLEVPPLPAEVARIAKNRLVFDGTSGDGTFITTPTTCLGEAAPGPSGHVYSTYLRADSYEEPDPSFPNGSAFVESPIPPGTEPRECDTIPFEPSLEADPQTARTDSPAGAAVGVNLPDITDPLKEGKQATSHVRSATVTLPEGMGLNPSAANGLEACADSQFPLTSRTPISCPAASRVGSVTLETPPLPPGSLTGDVFVGQQLSRDPASGEEFRIFVVAASQRYDVSVRLVGNVKADPLTGRLTTVFNGTSSGLPQAPFTSFVLDFNDGPRAPLTSPGVCGPHTASTVLTPWDGNAPVPAEDEFTLTEAAGGGDCPATLGARPFAPGLAAASASGKAGAYSPFQLDIARPDGQQELKGADVRLPRGLTAKLAGVDYCPEGAIAAAAANGGVAEGATSSCPASSLVGSAVVSTGTGPEPTTINGKAFLAGPYHGAPLSLAIVTPATAGPFDLGSVVVRVALSLDRETAQVTAVSDPIPHIFGGALLDVRTISVRLDRPNFSLNPTNCSPMAVEAALHGGGANPSDPAAFTTYSTSTPFQVEDCDALGFEPKLSLRLFGAMRRAKNPKLRATVVARPHDANISKAVVTLPKGLILDQASIANVCTRVQYAAGQCPADSVYGFARAVSPLLDKPLEGPVRLRSSDNLLPDVVASLHGQVNVDLVGRNDAVKGRLRNTFDAVPDVPIEKFELTVRGGKHGLLLNTRNLCPRRHKKKHRHGKRAHKRILMRGHHKKQHRHKKRKPMRANAIFYGQNGKVSKQRPKVGKSCKRKHRKHRKHRMHHRSARR
ncbi:MAG TPA: hypothetical protein VGF04_08310 [Solirubrobacterales bacterium]|jgi:hypothetical protein